jgi:hypothetical protein
MLIAITISFILILTALAFLVRKSVAPWLCPLCAGVAGTWLGLLGAHLAGFTVDLRLPAILLGGSVVGLAAQGEKILANRSETYQLVWKTLFVTIGFATAWFVINLAWIEVALGLAVLGVLIFLPWVDFSSPKIKAPSGRAQRLKEQMKSCC